ncbi:MAG: hypothetical protein AB7T05_09675, partial [Fimbriimonadaceae bacterium]
MADTPLNEKLVEGTWTEGQVDERIADIILDPTRHTETQLKVPKFLDKLLPAQAKSPWMAMVGIGFLLVNVLLVAIAYLVLTGIGIWGNNQPVGWGFDIINFVWWIGIGHAGTLISAILLLLRQRWRNSINRFAEAMTIFAVMCAGMYPLLHTGR